VADGFIVVQHAISEVFSPEFGDPVKTLRCHKALILFRFRP
jgi:hypothetical protein